MVCVDYRDQLQFERKLVFFPEIFCVSKKRREKKCHQTNW